MKFATVRLNLEWNEMISKYKCKIWNGNAICGYFLSDNGDTITITVGLKTLVNEVQAQKEQELGEGQAYFSRYEIIIDKSDISNCRIEQI